MKLNKQIKKYRTNMNLSQEEFAEKIYVTRQTVSNWENEKSYPDIHSILLMSSLFDVSLDQLIKGDLDIMKEEIKLKSNTNDIKKFNRNGAIFTALLIVLIVSAAPLVYFFDFYGMAAYLILGAVTMLFAIKVEKYKKEHNIQTYKEIVAFYNGERLDEIAKNREYGKRPYQKVLLALGSGFIALVVGLLWIVILFFIK